MANYPPASQTEDAAITEAVAIMIAGGARRDAETSPVSNDGDVHFLVFDALGRLKVVTPGMQTEDTPANEATLLQMIGGVRRDGSTSPVSSDGDVHYLVFDDLGRLKVSTGGMQVEDTAANDGQPLHMIGGVRRDAETSPVNSNLDVHYMVFDDLGRLKVSVGGMIADDAPLSGNPVRQGIKASDARPSSMSNDGDMVTPAADRSGQQYVLPGRVATATLSSVADSATTISLLASNTSRKGAILVNESDQALYLKYGATASLTSYTYRIDPYGTWEMDTPVYTGAIDGIWAANSTGNARITELTA